MGKLERKEMEKADAKLIVSAMSWKLKSSILKLETEKRNPLAH